MEKSKLSENGLRSVRHRGALCRRNANSSQCLVFFLVLDQVSKIWVVNNVECRTEEIEVISVVLSRSYSNSVQHLVLCKVKC